MFKLIQLLLIAASRGRCVRGDFSNFNILFAGALRTQEASSGQGVRSTLKSRCRSQMLIFVDIDRTTAAACLASLELTGAAGFGTDFRPCHRLELAPLTGQTMLITPSKAAPEELLKPFVVWEEVPCPMCAGRNSSPLIEAQDVNGGPDGLWFVIMQCDSCGTCFTNPRPDLASIGQFYGGNYTPHQKHHRTPGKKRWNPLRFLKGQPRVEKRPIRWHGQGRLLDFGCGSGAYLQAMHQLGWKVVGVDMSIRMVERVRDELGLPAYAGTLPHLELEPQSFDVITMWHALEHVHEPTSVLREARNLLAPGGKLVISVPNIDSLPFRWFGRDWFGLELPRHLTHFTPPTLLQMLQRCGFATEPIQFVSHADWLRASARRITQRHRQPQMWQWLLQFRLPARILAWYAHYAKQSDCILAVAHR
jgi:SAM-dependent methyltransferase